MAKDLVGKLKLDTSDFNKKADAAANKAEDLGDKTKKAAEKNDAWGSSFDKVSLALTGINQGMQIAAQVIAGFEKAYNATVGAYTKYAEEMYHASVLTGTTTEEMSRLVQVADDFRVSQEAMTGAMGMALKNGFIPTIDNLANLSDELLGIKDPAERAARATEIFGRQWEDVMPLLSKGGDAIRKATAGIADNLIVTKDGAAQTMEYVAQIDALSDAWTGYMNALGESAVPIISAASGTLALGLSNRAMNIEVAELTSRLEDLGLTAKEVKNVMGGKNAYFFDEKSLAQDLPVAIASMKQFQEQYRSLTDDLSYSSEAAITQLNGIYAALGPQIDKTQEWADANDRVYEEVTKITSSYDLMNTQIDTLSTKYLAQKDLIGKDLVDAYDRLQSATDTFRGGVAGNLVSAVEASTLTLEEQLTALGEVDKFFGTSYKMEMEMSLDLDELTAKFLEDPTSLAAEYAVFEDAFLPLQAGVIAAGGEIDALKANLASMERTYQTHLYVITHSIATDQASWMPPAMPNTQGGIPMYGPAFPNAGGGPIYAGQRVRTGEYGPEEFVAAQDGRILSRADSMNAVGQNAASEVDNSDILDAIDGLPIHIARAVRDAILLAS